MRPGAASQKNPEKSACKRPFHVLGFPASGLIRASRDSAADGGGQAREPRDKLPANGNAMKAQVTKTVASWGLMLLLFGVLECHFGMRRSLHVSMQSGIMPEPKNKEEVEK